MKRATQKAAEDYWAAVTAARADVAKCRDVGGGFTVREYMARFGVSEITARRQVRLLVDGGRAAVVGVRGKAPVYDLVAAEKANPPCRSRGPGKTGRGS